jgi:chitin disaccharide deacetylase
MKYLIVNGDDFGASQAINRGIVEAHKNGILTSASLMVDMPASEEAVLLSRDWPALSLGLHVHLSRLPVAARQGSLPGLTPGPNDDELRAELHMQFEQFQELVGRPPTHLDSHHNDHHEPSLLPLFRDVAEDFGLPLRGYSRVHYFPDFYGQWDGQVHLEQISVDSLVRMLRTQIHEGFTELSCHPGYACADQQSGYNIEREAELHTLCDPILREILEEQCIELTSFAGFANLVPGPRRNL